MLEVSKNMDSIKLYLHVLNYSFSVIAVSETWENVNNPVDLSLSGYNCVSKPRHAKYKTVGGGVALYIRDDIEFVVRDDLCAIANDNFECVFVEVISSTKHKYVSGCIYRPPGKDLGLFNSSFDNLLQKINSEKSDYFLAGDYNINLLKSDVHSETENFANTLFSNFSLPLICKPTRFAENSATLIDNIVSNVINDNYTAGILITDISDHLPVFCMTGGDSVDNGYTDYACSFTRTYRKVNDCTLNMFSSALVNADWTDVYCCTDVNKAYDLFSSKLALLYNESIPLEIIKTPHVNKCKPWITSALLVSIKRKHRYYRDSLKKKTKHAVNKYKKYKNKLGKLLRYAEKNIFC